MLPPPRMPRLPATPCEATIGCGERIHAFLMTRTSARIAGSRKNIFDKRYVSYSLANPLAPLGVSTASVAPPATYPVEASIKFQAGMGNLGMDSPSGDRKLLIDGNWQPAASGKVFETRN